MKVVTGSDLRVQEGTIALVEVQSCLPSMGGELGVHRLSVR